MAITANQLHEKVENNEDFILLDIRTPQEVDITRIPGGIYIPMDEVDQSISHLENKEIIVYCRSGARSGIVAQMLRQKGWDAKNLEGGSNAYAKIDEKIKKY